MATVEAIISTDGHLIDPNYDGPKGELLKHNDMVYNCTLNQTEIGNNKNKFYIMQLINSGRICTVMIRYGRIGVTGNISHHAFGYMDDAILFFEKQFKSKTGNNWSEKDNFQKKPGKYFMTEIEKVDTGDIDNVSESSNTEIEILDENVIKLLKLISNIDYMKNTLVELEIDDNKMPLGKISQKQITSAYEILKEISNVLKSKNKSSLIELSSEFYTLIPCACGMKKPPVIDNAELLGDKINLLNELSQTIVGNIMVNKLKKYKNVYNQLYNDLKTEIVSIDKKDEIYQILSDYLENSKAPTHYIKFKILNMYEIAREGEREAYDSFSDKLKNKTLLFHGTRTSNLIGILKNGLVVDPTRLGIKVTITGKMFGMGLYFANSCTKSINYCAPDTSDDIACLFVAEVALGKILQKTNSDYNLSAATIPKGYHSVQGLGGSTILDYDYYDDDTRVPCGKLVNSNVKDCNLLYDEFIVYHEGQFNLRYIVMLKVSK